MICLLEALSEQLEIRPVDDKDLPTVRNWILNKHYINRWPTGVRYKLGVYDGKKLIGTLLYGPPLRAQSGSELFKDDSGQPILKNNQALELLRAYTTDDAKQRIPNLGSTVIARGNDYIRKHGKTKQGLPIKAILSYADPEAGHSGGVYKATNAAYLGTQRPSKVLVVSDPETGASIEMHPMTLKRYGKDIQNHPALKGKKLEWKPVSGKHKYLYPLGADQKERNQLMRHLTVPMYSYPGGSEPPQVIANPAKQEKPAEPTKQSEPAAPKSKREVIKTLLQSKVRNPETNNMIMVATALKYDKTHPAYQTARGMVSAWAKKHNINVKER